MVSNPTTTSLAGWLAAARRTLAGRTATSTPSLEVQALAAFILSKPREWLIAHSELVLEPQQIEELENTFARLTAGVPLAYITGSQEFYNLSFLVTPAVLIPRPETELLVDHAVQWANKKRSGISALDVGTGSGCIAVALARHCPHVRLAALDYDANALQIAQKNILRHSLQNQISLVQSDLLHGIGGQFDMLLTNPPYIPSESLAALKVAMYEPHLALDGGEDGLKVIRNILQAAPPLLRPGGLLLMEIEATLSGPVRALAARSFPASTVEIIHDYAGLPRLLKISV